MAGTVSRNCPAHKQDPFPLGPFCRCRRGRVSAALLFRSPYSVQRPRSPYQSGCFDTVVAPETFQACRGEKAGHSNSQAVRENGRTALSSPYFRLAALAGSPFRASACLRPESRLSRQATANRPPETGSGPCGFQNPSRTNERATAWREEPRVGPFPPPCSRACRRSSLLSTETRACPGVVLSSARPELALGEFHGRPGDPLDAASCVRARAPSNRWVGDRSLIMLYAPCDATCLLRASNRWSDSGERAVYSNLASPASPSCHLSYTISSPNSGVTQRPVDKNSDPCVPPSRGKVASSHPSAESPCPADAACHLAGPHCADHSNSPPSGPRPLGRLVEFGSRWGMRAMA